MRIRKYMTLGILTIVMFPWIVYGVLHLLDTQLWKAQNGMKQANQTQAIQIISQNERNWTNPTWQHRMLADLKRKSIDAQLVSPSGQVILETVQHGDTHWMSSQQVVLMVDGKWIGTVLLYQPGWADPTAAIGMVVTAILAITFVSFQVGRNVIKPLESMSRAALQIAEGDLDFKLASSSAVEIREVRTAFQIMVSGLRDAFAKQQKLEEERRFFIGAIAHDLRTPLFSLRGYLDGIEQGIVSSPVKIAHYVAVCKEKAIHLERLVSDLFAFTQLEYMEQTLQSEQLNFTDIVNTTVASLIRKAQERKIVLNATTPNGNCLISGDPHLLERAITNLLDNSLRHTPEEGRITIELLRESEKVVLQISDTGQGFLPDDLPHIFEPMYRGDKSRNMATGGAGLGLTIARRIFRSHGGDLLAGNSPHGGAVLTGWIPRC